MTLWRYSPPFVFWVVGGAILVSYYGPVSILNPFRHLLSMVEAMRYAIQTMLGTQPPYQLFPIATEESLNTVAGIFGLAGWLTLMIVILVSYGATDI